MKRVLSVWVAVIMLLQVSFGHTLTITYNGDVTTREVEANEVVTFGLSSREEANYVVDSNNAILGVYGNRRQFVMPEGNVDISIMPKSEDLNSEVDVTTMKVGDYVEYHPTANTCDLTTITGVTQDALVPSATTQWIVLKNDGITVELVSADSVGTLTLGADTYTVDGVTFSEGSAGDLELSKTHYGNVIQILRQISEVYTDGEIAIAGRGLGWNGTSAETIPIENISFNYISTNGIIAVNGDPYDDTYYRQHGETIEDVDALIDQGMLHTTRYNNYVWLASRYLNGTSTNSLFTVRRIKSDGTVGGQDFVNEYSSGGAYSYTLTYGIRPVVTLKPGIKATPVGTEGNSWKLEDGIDNTSTTYTVSYNGNGGTGTTASSVHTYGISSTLRANGFSKEGYVFDSWNTKADGSGVKYTDEQAVRFVYGTTASNTVTLYAQWRKPYLAELAKVGDYVEYHPTAKTIDLEELTGIVQTSLNTADTTEWRVLSVDKDTGVVEIVSTDSVGTLILSQGSTRNSSGIFTAGSQEIMEQAKENYANAIYILNEISRQYATGVGTGRGLGYNGNAENVEKIITPITWEYTYNNRSTLDGKDPYDDTYYNNNGEKIKDVEILEANGMMHTSMYNSYVWLASRYLYTDSNRSYFDLWGFDTSGNVHDVDAMLGEASDGSAISFEQAYGVRPVVILKPGIKATTIGTEGNNWKIN